jgi:hypothetical protein
VHGDAAREVMRARRGGACSGQGSREVAARGAEAEVSGTFGHESQSSTQKATWATTPRVVKHESRPLHLARRQDK